MAYDDAYELIQKRCCYCRHPWASHKLRMGRDGQSLCRHLYGRDRCGCGAIPTDDETLNALKLIQGVE